jgi:phosphoribosylamine--glycine ligase
MRVLIIGSGGREHALAWKLSQSDRCTALFIAPGNPGTAQCGENVAIAVDDLDQLVACVERLQIDFTVVGPELPLALGIVDRLKSAGKIAFGPTSDAAKLEASKDFSKQIMCAAGVPTAQALTVYTREEAEARVAEIGTPIVLKADGLAAGKGVFVCLSLADVQAALPQLFPGGARGAVLVERFLKGREASLIVATDGEQIVPLAPSHDYKRVHDGDQGPNTGGMGTVSPTPHLSEQQYQRAIGTVIKPVLHELRRRGIPYQGFLYAGLMVADSGEIHCLEFNARLGDPETQVIMRRLESDLLPMLYNLACGEAVGEVTWSSNHAVCVVHAAEGYPDTVLKGDVIRGVAEAEKLEQVVVFHAGTGLNQQRALCTSSGRVLSVTACGSSLHEARERAYQASQCITFKGGHYRQDIGRS